MQDADRWFASDNNAAVPPAVMAALAAANQGHAIGYGHDPLTEEAERAVAGLFGDGFQVRFAMNGTGANVYALGCLAGHADAVFCSSCAHILVDETGGPTAVVGAQLVPLPHEAGKIQAYELLDAIAQYEDMHKPAPRVLSLSQPTELGTVYGPDELNELIRIAHEHGMAVHLDGARLANAAAFLAAAGDSAAATISAAPGIDSAAAGIDAAMALRAAVGAADVICFGGTKNGLMFGEAVVFAPQAGSYSRADRAALAARAGAGCQATEGDTASAAWNQAAAKAPDGIEAPALDTERLRKAHLQLSSKMRFLAAQFLAYVKDDLWLTNAAHANAMAKRLANGASALRFNPAFSVDTNAVFVMMAPSLANELKAKRFFYDWEGGLVRLMASWDSTESEVDQFLKDLKEADERFEEERAARKQPEVRSPSQDAELKRKAAACRRILKADLVPVDIIPSDQRLGLAPPPLQVPLDAASSADGVAGETSPAAAGVESLIPLPAPQAVRHLGAASFESVTAARKSRRAYGPQELSQEELSFLLWASAGMKQPEKAKRPGTVWALRTVPSGGCRHPLELFVYVRRVAGILPGLYRYRPIEHALAPVRQAPDLAAAARGAALEAQDAAFDRALYGQLWDCAALFVWTAVPYRTEWRYHMAAAKIILLDAGHACQSLYGACEALGLGTCALGAYEQAALDRLLGVDGEEELAIYAAPVGRPKGSEQSD